MGRPKKEEKKIKLNFTLDKPVYMALIDLTQKKADRERKSITYAQLVETEVVLLLKKEGYNFKDYQK